MKKNILLTGATGFLGSHIMAALVQRGHHVIALKRANSKTQRIEKILKHASLYNVDEIKIEKIFDDNKIDVIIHTATNYGKHSNHPLADIVNSNILFPCNILENALRQRTRCFINTDTFFSINNLNYKYLSTYTLSKKHFREWLNLPQHASSIKIVNMIIHHMYGQGDDQHKFTSHLLHAFLQNERKIPMTRGEQMRDFIHVHDVVEAYMLLVDNATQFPGNIQFDVGSGRTTSIKEFAITLKQKVEEALNKPVSSTLCFGALPYREGEPMRSVANITDLQNIGWRPKLSLEKGLEVMVKEELATISQTETTNRFASF